MIDFVWVRAHGTSTSIANLTSTNAVALLAGTLTEDKLFSGGNSATKVHAVGRDEDSGTRIAALADSGYGVHNYVKQYSYTGAAFALEPAATVDAIPHPAGDIGYSGGGALEAALALNDTAVNEDGLGYLGLNDANNLGTANWLTFARAMLFGKGVAEGWISAVSTRGSANRSQTRER